MTDRLSAAEEKAARAEEKAARIEAELAFARSALRQNLRLTLRGMLTLYRDRAAEHDPELVEAIDWMIGGLDRGIERPNDAPTKGRDPEPEA